MCNVHGPAGSSSVFQQNLQGAPQHEAWQQPLEVAVVRISRRGDGHPVDEKTCICRLTLIDTVIPIRNRPVGLLGEFVVWVVA